MQLVFQARPKLDWRIGSRTLTLGERTLLMAIVNLTPDSFSGDGLGGQPIADVIARALALIDEGADIVDLGAESTRPDAVPLTAEAEQLRMLPALEGLLRARPDAIVSVDTYHADTAQAAIAAGASIINDVSGLTWDADMPGVLAAANCGIVMMHTRGRPGEWRNQPPLAAEDVVPTVFAGLQTQLATALHAGINAERMVLDPGFGFGKRGATENFALLAGLDQLQQLGRPLLAGLSRKSFLGKNLAATIAANTAAIVNGAYILRVHDVAAAREAAAVADGLLLCAETL